MNVSGSTSTPAHLLLEAFSSFTEASTSLERAYWGLLEKVEQLSSQLEQSNYYLNSVLQSLPCGVMVINEARLVGSMNRTARELFGLDEVELPCPLADLLGDASFSDRATDLTQVAGDFTEITLGKTKTTLQCYWSRMRDNERVLVVQDVTQLRRLEQQMQEAGKLSAKGEMALEVAHEIRNPLGALELFASLLAEEDLSREERDQYLTNIQIGIRSLNTVLTNMLCFSRNPSPSKEPIQVGEMLLGTAAFMKPLLDQRGIEALVDCRDDVRVNLDPEMLRQILTNLVTNALQALPEGGKLELKSWSGPDSVYILVADSGKGIPPEHQRLIFDSGFTTHGNGHGLGLAIVRQFVETHGGTITVESRQGQGTQFTLSFPTENGTL